MRVLGLVIFMMTGSAASAFTAINGLTAYPAGHGQIEVISTGGAGPRQIWCAGAQFALFEQGAQGNTRLYITRGLAPSTRAQGRKSVIFTTRANAELKNGPRPGDGGNYSVSLKKIGFNLRVAHAEGFCDTILQELYD